MAMEYLNEAVLFLYEITHEIDKHCVQINSDSSDVAMKYQGPFWHKALQSLVDINILENIHLIQACVNHDHCKILSKGH